MPLFLFGCVAFLRCVAGFQEDNDFIMEITASPAGHLAEKTPAGGLGSSSPKLAKLERESKAMATIRNDDERMLARIGYRQVCQRERTVNPVSHGDLQTVRSCAESSPNGLPSPMLSPFLGYSDLSRQHLALPSARGVPQRLSGAG